MPWTNLGSGASQDVAPIVWQFEGSERLDVFIVDGTGQIRQRTYNGRSNQWEPQWHSIPGATGFASSPAVVSERPDSVHLFGRGQSSNLRHVFWDGSAWRDDRDTNRNPAFLGITWTPGARPVAISWGPGRIDVFAPGNMPSTGSGLAILQWFTVPGTPLLAVAPHGRPVEAGGSLTNPIVASWAPNRLDVFLQQGANEMFHRWWDGANWQLIGPIGRPAWEPRGFMGTGPTAVSMQSAQLDIFGQGRLLDQNSPTHGYAIEHQWWDGSTWSAENMTDLQYGLLSAIRRGDNEILLMSAHNQEVRHKVWMGQQGGNPRAGQWSPARGWGSLGSPSISNVSYAPRAVRWSSGRIDVFVNTAGAVWTNTL